MIEPALRQLLAEASAVTSIATGGVHLGARPQDERRPCVVLTKISDVAARYLNLAQGYRKARVQADVLAPTSAAAKQLAAAVRTTLDRFEGDKDDTHFAYIMADEERDIATTPLKGQAAPTFGVSIDFQCMYFDQE